MTNIGIVLGIETSCDETGVAIYDCCRGLLANQLYSQSTLHANYGGVVPELASRDHAQRTAILIQSVIDQSGIKASDIHGVAYTAGPGLASSLLVGATIGRALAYAWQVPAVAINHMEGHLLAPMLELNPPEFPFTALLVSGGHTQLIEVMNVGKYRLLGESIDDAAGEVFDKVANLLGLDYPGGKKLEHLAKQGKPGRYVFPRPMTNRPGLGFSFSGLKTSVANTIKSSTKDYQTKADIALAFEEAIVDTLVIKCKRALDFTGLSRLVVSGGVSANCVLRDRLNKMMQLRKGKMFCSRPEFCTDNGAMIAYAGMIRLQSGLHVNLEISIKPKWSIEELPMVNL